VKNSFGFVYGKNFVCIELLTFVCITLVQITQKKWFISLPYKFIDIDWMFGLIAMLFSYLYVFSSCQIKIKRKCIDQVVLINDLNSIFIKPIRTIGW